MNLWKNYQKIVKRAKTLMKKLLLNQARMLEIKEITTRIIMKIYLNTKKIS